MARITVPTITIAANNPESPVKTDPNEMAV
jgi:hypothetical protein